MFTILGSDGKEYGPVTAGKLHEWIAGGRANLQTKARRADETEWRTLGDFPEFSQFGTGGATAGPAVLVASVAPVAPAEPPDVPAAAYPAAVGPLTGSPAEIAAYLNARTPLLDIFGCLTRAFELWKAHFLPLVGITLLVLVVQMMVGLVPLLGMVSGLFLNGVFYGGLYYYYLGRMRGEPREVGDAFAGFSRTFVPLMLTTLLQSVIILAVMMPFLGSLFFVIIKAAVQGHSGVVPTFSPLALVGMAFAMVALLYLSISWIFAFALVIDQGLPPWTALEVSRRVVGRQWFRVFLVVLLATFLAMLGFIALFIGIFFTLPLMFAAVMCAYEDLCRPPAAGAGR